MVGFEVLTQQIMGSITMVDVFFAWAWEPPEARAPKTWGTLGQSFSLRGMDNRTIHYNGFVQPAASTLRVLRHLVTTIGTISDL